MFILVQWCNRLPLQKMLLFLCFNIFVVICVPRYINPFSVAGTQFQFSPCPLSPMTSTRVALSCVCRYSCMEDWKTRFVGGDLAELFA